MKLLALDTTESACSVAVMAGETLLWRHEETPRRHSERILPMVASLLAEAGLTLTQLDGIAFSRGPGAFTGVRIATAVAQGLALGADLPLAPVSTLVALAEGARRECGAAHVLSALDARMGELYWAAVTFDPHGRAGFMAPEQVAPPPRVRAPQREDWVALGSGWDAHAEALLPRFRPVRLLRDRKIQARDVARQGGFVLEAGGGVAPAAALPVYLRDEVARKPSSP